LSAFVIVTPPDTRAWVQYGSITLPAGLQNGQSWGVYQTGSRSNEVVANVWASVTNGAAVSLVSSNMPATWNEWTGSQWVGVTNPAIANFWSSTNNFLMLKSDKDGNWQERARITGYSQVNGKWEITLGAIETNSRTPGFYAFQKQTGGTVQQWEGLESGVRSAWEQISGGSGLVISDCNYSTGFQFSTDSDGNNYLPGFSSSGGEIGAAMSLSGQGTATLQAGSSYNHPVTNWVGVGNVADISSAIAAALNQSQGTNGVFGTIDSSGVVYSTNLPTVAVVSNLFSTTDVLGRVDGGLTPRVFGFRSLSFGSGLGSQSKATFADIPFLGSSIPFEIDFEKYAGVILWFRWGCVFCLYIFVFMKAEQIITKGVA